MLRCLAALAMLAAAPGARAFTVPVGSLASPVKTLHSSCNGRMASPALRSRKPSALSLRAQSNNDPMRPREPGLSPLSGGGFSSKGEPTFQIRGFSLANFTLFAGLFITFYSFYQYFSNQNSLTSLGFVYGLPIALGGFALKYAEILPVPVDSNEKGDAIFEAKGSEILKKVVKDVTRHRYGDDAHLDSSLEKLGLVVEGKGFPQMQKITMREEFGELAFTMQFQSKDTPFTTWADPQRIRKYESFFGGLNAEVIKVSKEERLVAIKLTTGEARRGKGSMTADSTVSTGGGVKMEAEVSAPAAKEEKKVMEI